MDILSNIIIQVIPALLGVICTYLYNKLKQKNKEQIVKDKAMCALLRYTIRKECKEAIKVGIINEGTKSDVLNCYTEYENLINSNGIINGVIDDIIEEMRKLPTE